MPSRTPASRSRRPPPRNWPRGGWGRCCASTTPLGNAVEVFCGAALEHRPAVSPLGNQFVTGDMGMGHVVLPVAVRCADACVAFYTGGARLPVARLDAHACGIRWRVPRGSAAVPRFLGRNPRHHSLALAPMPEPCPDRAPHGRGGGAGRRGPGPGPCAAARRRRWPRRWPGRQRPDGVVLRAHPGQFHIEYGTDGRTVDDATWVSRETTAVSLWGHSFACPYRSDVGRPGSVRCSATSAPVSPSSPALRTAARPGSPARRSPPLSLDPPLVLFCPARSSATWPMHRPGRVLLRQRARRRAAGDRPAVRRARGRTSSPG